MLIDIEYAPDFVIPVALSSLLPIFVSTPDSVLDDSDWVAPNAMNVGRVNIEAGGSRILCKSLKVLWLSLASFCNNQYPPTFGAIPPTPP
jgi:hypothetical protein